MAENGKTLLRNLKLSSRRAELESRGRLSAGDFVRFGLDQDTLDLCDVLVENCIGYMPVPLGVAEGFLIDGEELVVPMATEEPSVIAAASFAASLVARHGGFRTWACDPVMTAQVFLEGALPDAGARVEAEKESLLAQLRESLASLVARGGGPVDLRPQPSPEIDGIVVAVDIDVRDAMGANILNTAAESIQSRLETLSGGSTVMSILTNSAERRRAAAELSIPLAALAGASRTRQSAAEIGRRMELASRIAAENRDRAVTHNKGIMNGISALALATGNDTRGIESAAHAWASRDGSYRGLSSYRVEGDALRGTLEMPLPFGTVGGAVGFHPTARAAMRALGDPGAVRLSRIAAAVGLAQNLAALFALVTTGIQQGHMGLHARRLAYDAGARGAEIAAVARTLRRAGTFSSGEAARVLAELRAEGTR